MHEFAQLGPGNNNSEKKADQVKANVYVPFGLWGCWSAACSDLFVRKINEIRPGKIIMKLRTDLAGTANAFMVPSQVSDHQTPPEVSLENYRHYLDASESFYPAMTGGQERALHVEVLQ